jgi:molybdate transport system regulatory protein
MTRLLLRLYFSDESWLGPGKVQLLEAIRSHGSISAAARSIPMSYRRAWLLVNSINRMFSEPAVRTTLGGRGGGTAQLTPLGAEITSRYRSMEAAASRAVARDSAALARRLQASKTHPRRSAAGEPS